jgi:hypothetical protein
MAGESLPNGIEEQSQIVVVAGDFAHRLQNIFPNNIKLFASSPIPCGNRLARGLFILTLN